MLSAPPDTPLTGPISDSAVTNQEQIRVLYGPQDPTMNGGSEILSYELYMDNGRGGDFTSLIGGGFDSLETAFTISDGLVSGLMYRFRYRSRNINGFSQWSPITYIKAASVPSRPQAPSFVSATSSTITIRVYSSDSSRGSDISSIEIWRNLGGTSLDWVQVDSVNSATLTYIIDISYAPVMVAGTIYKVKTRTVND